MVADLPPVCNPSYSLWVAPQDDTLDTLRAFQARMDAMPARRAELIAAARAAGHSWPKIGAALGMTHQGAMKAAEIQRKPSSE